MNKKAIFLWGALALLPACGDVTSPNPGNNATNDGEAGAGGAGGKAYMPAPLPPADEPAPPCAVPAELLDDQGALVCLEGTTYLYAAGDYLEQCTTTGYDVVLGHEIDPLERQISHRGSTLPPSWWVADGLMWLCDEEVVVVIEDLARGCTVRCWAGWPDDAQRCDPCGG